MDTESATADDPGDFLDPDFASVVDLERTTRDIAAIVNGEHDRLEKVPVLLVKWTVDEDAVFLLRRRH